MLSIVKKKPTLTPQSLTDKPIEHGSTVVAEGESLVGVLLESMRNIDVESLSCHLLLLLLLLYILLHVIWVNNS